MILLVSASPRRRELLASVGLDCRVSPVDLDESPLPGESARRLVRRLALAKLEAGRPALAGERLALAADTVVVLRGRILGKPGDLPAAARMLAALAGRAHRVMTGMAVLDVASGRVVYSLTTTRVRFRKLDGCEIDEYLSRDDVLGCAGAYRIQGRGVFLARSLRGSYSNVVGLPLETLGSVLRHLGFPLYGSIPGR